MAQQAVAIQDARILVVEDDDNNRLIATKLLQLAGANEANIFVLEGDPLPFLQAQLPQCVNLILLDLQLPGKDGYAILEELRKDAALAQIPVMAMTANVMKTDMERIQAAGFDGFIGKPINARLFGEWVRRSLSGEIMWTNQ
jgi:CheY-like chemotaxis protein